MASSILIMLWVTDEMSYDRFHAEKDNIYRLTASLPELNIFAAVSSSPLAAAFKEEIPEIKDGVRVQAYSTELLQVDDRMFNEKKIIYADSNFFEFFSYSIVHGDAKTALLQPESIVISEAMAIKYFGNEDPIGKTIRKDHKDDLTVSAVMSNVKNSHLDFDFVIPMAFLARTNDDLKNLVWDNFNYFTYFNIREGADLSTLPTRFREIYKKNEEHLKVAFDLQPLTDIHLHSNFMADVPGHGNIQYVYIFAIVGIFILAVACINFMNLATARSARRAKEVGMRKVAGAMRFQLIRQFLAESSLISVFALLLAIAIVVAVLPSFNEFSEKTLSISFLNIKMVAGLLGITFITGLLAGSYPAFFLSSFTPSKVLKGNLQAGAKSSVFRNTMVIVQFTVSIALLVGTGVVYNQLQFIKNKNIGFDKENMIYSHMTGELWNKYQTLRSNLEQNSATSNFCFVTDLPTSISNGTINVKWEGKDPNTQPLFSNLGIDDNFFKVFNLTILNGRGFSKDIAADTSNYLVNETCLKTLNMTVENAVGQKLSLWDNPGVIVGVVKDFNFKPMQNSIEPIILRYNRWGGIAVVKTEPQKMESSIDAMENIFKTLNPEHPFAYDFIDQNYANLYKSEQKLGSLFSIFAGLAIFISCLGLYGLSAFLAERRTKEIGVRKVLGAPVSNIVFLLSKTFTKPILIAMVIATPPSWYAMDRWLSGFAYHVDIHWSVFAIAFVASLSIAWITVSFESIKAAIADPAKSLRDE